jgi:putative hemolysin
VRREDGSWLVDGLLPLDEFEEAFGARIRPDEEKDYQTLAGFVLDRLGHIPAVGDYFDWEGLRFEGVDMDRLRIDRLLIRRLDEARPSGEV